MPDMLQGQVADNATLCKLPPLDTGKRKPARRPGPQPETPPADKPCQQKGGQRRPPHDDLSQTNQSKQAQAR